MVDDNLTNMTKHLKELDLNATNKTSTHILPRRAASSRINSVTYIDKNLSDGEDNDNDENDHPGVMLSVGTKRGQTSMVKSKNGKDKYDYDELTAAEKSLMEMWIVSEFRFESNDILSTMVIFIMYLF